MKSFATIAKLLVFFCIQVLADADKPKTKLNPGKTGVTGPSKIFTFKPYEDYQISDGVDENGKKDFKAGNALKHAEAVFDAPFKDSNAVSQMTQVDLENLYEMTQTAIDNEIHFTKAIEKAGRKSELGVQLERGKIANKVLKIKGAIKVIEIQKLLGFTPVDAKNRLEELNTKLGKNAANDKHNQGKPMLSYLSVDKFKAGSEKTHGSRHHEKQGSRRSLRT